MRIDFEMGGPDGSQQSHAIANDGDDVGRPGVGVSVGVENVPKIAAGQGVEALYGAVRSIGGERRPLVRSHDLDALREDPGVAFLTGTEVGLLGEVCRVIGVRRLSLVGRSVEPDFDPDIEVVEILVEAGPGPAASLDPEDDIEAWVDFGFELERHIRLPVELVSPDEFAEAETERQELWPRPKVVAPSTPG